MVGNNGDVCNTEQMNFGVGGRRRKFVINGTKY